MKPNHFSFALLLAALALAACSDSSSDSGCPVGFHDGGDATCVEEGICSDGYHDAGNGICVKDDGECSTGFATSGTDRLCCAEGYHDGGDEVCVQAGSCSRGFVKSQNGGCGLAVQPQDLIELAKQNMRTHLDAAASLVAEATTQPSILANALGVDSPLQLGEVFDTFFNLVAAHVLDIEKTIESGDETKVIIALDAELCALMPEDAAEDCQGFFAEHAIRVIGQLPRVGDVDLAVQLDDLPVLTLRLYGSKLGVVVALEELTALLGELQNAGIVPEDLLEMLGLDLEAFRGRLELAAVRVSEREYRLTLSVLEELVIRNAAATSPQHLSVQIAPATELLSVGVDTQAKMLRASVAAEAITAAVALDMFASDSWECGGVCDPSTTEETPTQYCNYWLNWMGYEEIFDCTACHLDDGGCEALPRGDNCFDPDYVLPEGVFCNTCSTFWRDVYEDGYHLCAAPAPVAGKLGASFAAFKAKAELPYDRFDHIVLTDLSLGGQPAALTLNDGTLASFELIVPADNRVTIGLPTENDRAVDIKVRDYLELKLQYALAPLFKAFGEDDSEVMPWMLSEGSGGLRLDGAVEPNVRLGEELFPIEVLAGKLSLSGSDGATVEATECLWPADEGSFDPQKQVWLGLVPGSCE